MRTFRSWFLIALVFVLGMPPGFTQETEPFSADISGYVKSFNFLTRTSGFNPEVVDSPLGRSSEEDTVFLNFDRLRLKNRFQYNLSANQRLLLKIDYDHKANFGSFVSTGDFRIAQRQVEERQFLDTSQTFIERNSVFYEHELYRATIAYESPEFDLEIGRQQIPWGVGHFFTPTDLFNPFIPIQLELDERDGVDAANITFKNIMGMNTQLVYAPPGKQLHPQRYLARVSRDVEGFEIGALGGRVKRDWAAGFDAAGNVKDAVVRWEFLYREARLEKDFIKFTVNAEYNFPHNVLGLLEYHFNGQGRRDPDDYQIDRQIRGELQNVGKNYLAAMLGRDMTSLIRVENRVIYNMDDTSFFIRPEVQYEFKPNWLFTAGAQFFAGGGSDEFGDPEHIYFCEVKYSFQGLNKLIPGTK